MGDLFAPVLELKQRLPDIKGVAATAAAAPAISIAAQAEDESESTQHRSAKETAKRTRRAKRKV
jgi:hypothetical protein